MEFKTKYYDAIDNYVVLPKTKKDINYTYGFIYIDQLGGITLRCAGIFNIKEGAIISGDNITDVTDIHKLTKETMKLHVLSDSEISTLKLSKIPEWLQTYESAINEAKYFTNRGRFLNAAGASHKALSPLLKAYKTQPQLKGLEYEIAYAYNATSKFDKAIKILNKAIKKNPYNNALFKELGYAYNSLKKADKAEEAYGKAIENSKNDVEKSTIAFNLAQTYFEERNVEKFNKWEKKLLEYSNNDIKYVRVLDDFKSKWGEDQ